MVRYIRPSKIQFYSTSKLLKKNASQVRKATGADVVINGTLFEYGSWKPCCVVKANGKVLCNDGYNYSGLAWDNADHRFTVDSSKNIAKWDNFISCIMLYKSGAAQTYYCNADVKRTAGRTAIVGLKDGRIALWVVKDGQNNMTPAQLSNAIINKFGSNIDYALMLDGGGSSQLSQEGSEYVYSTRKVQNYICFWDSLEADEPKGVKPMVEINAYSKKLDGKKKLSTNFTVSEFACKSGADTVLVAPRLVMVLQSIRSHFGRAVYINSAYRTPEHNKKVGGVEDSQHTYGTAADIRIVGLPQSELAKYIETLMPDWGGIGIYKDFVHVDVREVKARWKG